MPCARLVNMEPTEADFRSTDIHSSIKTFQSDDVLRRCHLKAMQEQEHYRPSGNVLN